MKQHKNIIEEVKVYIKKYWLCDIGKLNINTTLDDIGMFGDDKYEFLIDFAKNFHWI